MENIEEIETSLEKKELQENIEENESNSIDLKSKNKEIEIKEENKNQCNDNLKEKEEENFENDNKEKISDNNNSNESLKEENLENKNVNKLNNHIKKNNSQIIGVKKLKYKIIKNKSENKKENKKENKNMFNYKSLSLNNIFKLPKIKPSKLKIVFLYLRKEFYLFIKPTITLNEIKILISEKINLKPDKFDMLYNNKKIPDEKMNDKLKDFINLFELKIRPIFLIKKKIILYNLLPLISPLYSENYSNKVKIINYPSMADKNISSNDHLFKIINDFFNDYLIKKDYICERNHLNEFIISFHNSDIAFDFNRYMLAVKNKKPLLKDVKIVLIKKKQLVLKKNIEKKNNLKRSIQSPSKMTFIWDYFIE